MAKLTARTAAQIISGLRAVRAMDADRVSEYVPQGPQRNLSWDFVDWAATNNVTFGPANIGAVFDQFEAARAVAA